MPATEQLSREIQELANSIPEAWAIVLLDKAARPLYDLVLKARPEAKEQPAGLAARACSILQEYEAASGSKQLRHCIIRGAQGYLVGVKSTEGEALTLMLFCDPKTCLDDALDALRGTMNNLTRLLSHTPPIIA